MKTYLKSIFSLFLVLSLTSLFAQDKKEEKSLTCPANYECIKIDPISGVLEKELPLDKPIILYGDSPLGNNKNGCFSIWGFIDESKYKPKNSEDLCNYQEFITDICGNCPLPEKKYIRKIYNGILNFKELTFLAKIDKFLKPNKQYLIRFESDIALSNELRNAVFEQILNFYINMDEKLKMGGIISNNDIRELKKKLIDKIPQQALPFFKRNKFINLDGVQNPSVDVNLLNLITTQKSYLAQIEGFSNTMSDNISAFLANNINEITSNVTEERANIFLRLNQSKSNRILFAKGQANYDAKEKLFDSKEKLSDLKLNSLDNDLLDKYLKNLKESKTIINDLKINPNFGSSSVKLQEILDGFASINQYLGFIKDTNSDIKTTIESSVSPNLFKIITKSLDYAGTTEITLEASANLYINPDIGALTTNLAPYKSQYSNDAWRVIPYLGMSLYFSPMNINASISKLFKEYRYKALLKITSLHFGVTIPAIDTDKYKGIFLGESKQRGFVFGIGIRPYRALKFTGGYMFMNRANGGNLNTSFSLSARPYFSLALDWKVRSLIPSITKIIP